MAVAVVLVGAGVTWATWSSHVAKLDDVDHARHEAATNLATTSSATTAQLGALQVQQQALGERLARVEGGLNAMADDMRFLREQLVEIARATGARQVKP